MCVTFSAHLLGKVFSMIIVSEVQRPRDVLMADPSPIFQSGKYRKPIANGCHIRLWDLTYGDQHGIFIIGGVLGIQRTGQEKKGKGI
jgi:hypothetical protein